MHRFCRWAPLLISLAGCKVEPPFERTPLDATVQDAAPTTDGGVRDAGATDCRLDPASCAAGLGCARDGLCRVASSTCAATAQCVSPEVCLGGVSPARCGAPPGFCVQDGDCGANGRCTPAGRCVPQISGDGTLVELCGDDLDCGPGGLCRAGGCVGCSEAVPCTNGLECFFGFCLESFDCQGTQGCFSGNRCEPSGCVRSTDGCTPDRGNDDRAGAVLLNEQDLAGPTICGEDVDWYRFQLESGVGARVIVQTDPRVLTVSAALYDATEPDDVPPTTARGLQATGVTLFEVSSSSGAQSLLLRVGGLDVSGPYRVALERLPSWCAGDLLDLYGDRTAEEALLVPPDIEIDLVACPADVDRVRIPVLRSDRWSIRSAFTGPGTSLGVRVLEGNAAVASRDFTAASQSPLAVPPPVASGERTVEVTARRVPSAGQAYTLGLSVLPGPRIEACAGVTALAGIRGDDLAGAVDLGVPTCGPFVDGAAPDRIYRIDPPRAGALLLATVRQTAGATAAISLALLETCDDDAASLSCDGVVPGLRGAAIEAVATSTRPWFLLVSADPPAGVAFEVEAAFDRAGDYSCRNGGATPLLSSGTRAVSTFAATNTAELEAAAACGASFGAGVGAGPDRFFALSLGATERAVLELDGPSGGFLWAGTSCEELTATCAAADSLEFGKAARIVLAPSGATNYLVAVDGYGSLDAGDYALRSIFMPECVADMECQTMATPMRRCDDYRCADPPANDRCAGAELVTLVSGRATIRASTGAAQDDFAGTGSGCGGSGEADLVYAVDLPAGLTRFRARITQASWDPIVSLRRADCASAPAQVACNDDPRPDPDEPPTSALSDLLYAPAGGITAGRYFLIVDAYQGRGPFTLELETN